MSLYQCDDCGCVENTACGHYHSNTNETLWSKEYLNKKLCSACGPTHFLNGEPVRADKFGEWHGRFRRRFFPMNSLYKDREGNVRRKDNDEYPDKDYELVMPEAK